MTAQLCDALTFNNGAKLENRFMLAPLTNLQSGTDGVLSDDEYQWLTYRAEGGFGLTMTCAASVQRRPAGSYQPGTADAGVYAEYICAGGVVRVVSQTVSMEEAGKLLAILH